MINTKILIVEDEAIVAVNIRSILTELGYETVGISVTADDAVRKAKEFNPDIILMDIKLRGDKSGVDAAREIRKTSDTAIIFLTAYSDIELLKNAEDIGAVAYMVKPLQKDKLAICIKLVIYKLMVEQELTLKTKELEKVTPGAQYSKLEDEVRILREKLERHKKELMLFINK